MGRLGSILLNVLVVFLALAGGIFQIYLKPLLATWGAFPAREVQPTGGENCKTVYGVEACESERFLFSCRVCLVHLFASELVIHQPSGLVYLACSTPESRAHWLPTMSQLNSTGASTKDYVAIYNPTTSDITRLTTPDFNNGRGLSVHGMDVVPSASDPDVLFVYLINHRIPLGNKSAAEVGADSVIEIFKTTVGGKVLEHIRTVEDPTVIIAPNDVVGSADGTSFYFTNDHGSRVGLVSPSSLLLALLFVQITSSRGISNSSVKNNPPLATAMWNQVASLH